MTSPVRRRPGRGVLAASHVSGLSLGFHRHDALLRFVGIAEGFAVNRFLEVSDVVVSDDTILQHLWQRELKTALDTWERRDKSWKRYFAVDVETYGDHARLRGYVEARNAIVHGLGELSRKQRANPADAVAKLRKAGITVVNNRVVIEAAHVDDCARTVIAFVRWLDTRAELVISKA
ncbi:MAG: hypothetical protein JHC84_06705 [Solirubrobacteraceae bacterium]|nr:hypothetical protein [Solirubrobacteraceae bacterium]